MADILRALMGLKAEVASLREMLIQRDLADLKRELEQLKADLGVSPALQAGRDDERIVAQGDVRRIDVSGDVGTIDVGRDVGQIDVARDVGQIDVAREVGGVVRGDD